MTHQTIDELQADEELYSIEPYGGPGMLGVAMIFLAGVVIGFALGAWLV